MIMQSDFRPGSSDASGGSGPFGDSSFNKSPKFNSSIPRDSRYQWSSTSDETSAEAVRGPTEGLAIISE